MNTPLKLTAFVAVLIAVAALAFVIGRAVGPIGEDDMDHGGMATTHQTLDSARGSA